MDNNEISMRIETDIKSGEYFYTDLNGFQVLPMAVSVRGKWINTNATRFHIIVLIYPDSYVK